jgi:GATA-binding protein, other eukaryote
MANTKLKTKVSELEVINGLFNDRLQQLESEHRQCTYREEDYRRRIAQLEAELSDLRRGSPQSLKRSVEEDESPYAKRSRISDVSEAEPTKALL